MGTVNHLLGALGRLLLWVAGALVVEELTLAGLARLICRHVTEAQRERAAKAASRRDAPALVLHEPRPRCTRMVR